MDTRILIAEDDEHIGNAVAAFLKDSGYLVERHTDGKEALERLMEAAFDLVILDIMLPGLDGQRLLKELRAFSDTPVLMMTALSGEVHEVNAFDNKADDYITKPFSLMVLLKRVQALLRRSGTLKSVLKIGPLSIDDERIQAFWNGVPLALTLREFEIVKFLAERAGKVVSHETLLSRVWGYDSSVYDGVVLTHIKNIRAKLKELTPVEIIHTVRGAGYRLEI